MSETNLVSATHVTTAHSMRLLLTLLRVGLIPRGKFSLVDIRHDDGCPALGGSALDCRCDCEAEVGGRVYLFSETIRELRP